MNVRVLWALAAGAFITLAVILTLRMDEKKGTDAQRRYTPFFLLMYPMFYIAMSLFGIIAHGRQGIEKTLCLTVSFMIPLTLYMLLLLLAMPWLRRHISARVCAALWLIPGLMLCFPGERPLWVLRPAPWLFWCLGAIWAAGAVVVLTGKIVQHILFRRSILRCAVDAADKVTLEQWRLALQDANETEAQYRLVVSDAVTTPLSVGFLKNTICVVLPKQAYTAEELSLIFRHELIHIGRQDALAKFIYAFFAALCWFNPFFHKVLEKSAEDVELSCDETVLLGADEDTRRKYARLLLDMAGDSRGFTTCLSASAEGMRYRLRNIVSPSPKRSGAVLAGLLAVILLLSENIVTVAYEYTSGAEKIFDGGAEGYTVSHIEFKPGGSIYCSDKAALKAWLSELRLEKVTGNYEYDENKRYTIILNEASQDVSGVVLCRDGVKLWDGQSDSSQWYHYTAAPDWEKLEQTLVVLPTLKAKVETDADCDTLTLYPDAAWDEEGTCLFDLRSPEGINHGRYSVQLPQKITIPLPEEAVLPFTFTVENEKEQKSCLLQAGSAMDLPDIPSVYTLEGVFAKEGKQYKVLYCFELGHS